LPGIGLDLADQFKQPGRASLNSFCYLSRHNGRNLSKQSRGWERFLMSQSDDDWTGAYISSFLAE
jgi:hypothetical protein